MTDDSSQSKAHDDEVKEKGEETVIEGEDSKEQEGGEERGGGTNEGDEAVKEKEKKVDLLKVKVDSESVALNVLIGFIGLAQRRGAFAVNESAKIFEAIKFFMPEPSS